MKNFALSRLNRSQATGLLLGLIVALLVFWAMVPNPPELASLQRQLPNFQYIWPACLLFLGAPLVGFVFSACRTRGIAFWLGLVAVAAFLPLISVIAGHFHEDSLHELSQYPIKSVMRFLFDSVVLSWIKLNSLLCFAILAAAPLIAEKFD